jgi:hypothetical protein
MVEYNEDVIVNSPYKLEVKDLLAARNILRIGPNDVQCINLQDIPSGDSPLLYIDRGVVVKKDIAAIGGALFTAGDPNQYNGCGGGAIMMGHAFTDTSDPPMIVLSDSSSGYNTLWIKQGDGDPNNRLAINWLWGNLELGNLTVHGNLLCTGPITGLVTHVAAILDNTLRAIGDYIGLNPNASATFAGMTLNGALQVNAPSQTGITLGNGTIYWQTSTNPNVLEMNCGLIIDGALNVAGISVNGTLGVTGQASANNFWINGSWLNSSSTLYIGGASGAPVTMYMNGNVNPISDNSYGLGSGSNRWQGIVAVNGYFNNLYPTGELRIPTSAPGSPQNGDIWLA